VEKFFNKGFFDEKSNIKITKKLQIDDNCEMQLKTLANKMQVFYNMDRLAI